METSDPLENPVPKVQQARLVHLVLQATLELLDQRVNRVRRDSPARTLNIATVRRGDLLAELGQS